MKRIASMITGLLLAAPLAALAQGDAYPTQPIKIIVPFSAGGVVDTITRVIGDKLSKKLGQSIIVENKTGAGGAVGTQYAKRADADGYTLLSVSPGHVVGPLLLRSAGWDPVKDFRAIEGFGVISNVFVVKTSTPVKTMPDLIALAKKSPKPITYGTAGVGTSNHLSGLLLEQMANVKMEQVPYRGQPAALNDLLAGRLTTMPLTSALAKPHIDSGDLRPLAVTTAARSSLLPNIPTVAESANLPDYAVATWFGFVAPAKTPDAIVNKLSTAVREVLEMPDVKSKLSKLGLDLDPRDPAQFDKYIAAESVKWTKVLHQAGIKAQ